MKVCDRARGLFAIAIAAMAIVACSAEEATPDETTMNDGAENEMKSGARRLMVEDLDGDGKKETFSPKSCGTGGCTYTIEMSKVGFGGQVFAKIIQTRPSTGADGVKNLVLVTTGGPCDFLLEHMEWGPAKARPGGEYRSIAKVDCAHGTGPFAVECEGLVPPQCSGR